MKNMKNTIHILAIGMLTILLIPSCSGFLDTTPSNRVSSETAMLTLRDADLAVGGMYDRTKTTSYYGAAMTLLGDNRGDDFQPRSLATGGWIELYSLKYAPNLNTYFALWDRCYNTIMRANAILEGWENLPAQSASEVAQKNDIKGQALAVRAFCHFDLVRSYGYPYLKDNGQSLGVVIVNKTIAPDEALEMERSTVAETYTFILNDLQESLPLLSKLKNTGKFNYWGARMLQARVCLYKGDYEAAFLAAADVINNSPYNLVSNEGYLNDLGTQGGAETIFEILVGADRQQDMDANNNFDGVYNNIWHANPGMGRLIPTQAWLDLMAEDPADVRGKVISVGDGLEGTTWIKKFPGIGGDFKRNNPRIFRLTEAYLIAAEAALATSRQSDANTYLDVIRKRANPDNPAITCTLDEVLKERRKEFIGEGHRFFDLMRLGKTVERVGGFHFAQLDGCPESFDWSFFKVVLPISDDAIRIYPNLQQNPGY